MYRPFSPCFRTEGLGMVFAGSLPGLAPSSRRSIVHGPTWRQMVKIGNAWWRQMANLSWWRAGAFAPQVSLVDRPSREEDMFWIIGHRGCGENVLRRSHSTHQKAIPGIRENTVASFTQAAAHGAHMVEFDVQVTADDVAVIFHDDYLVHGSLCGAERSLVRQLTAQQFGKLGPTGNKPLLRWFRDSETHEHLRWDMNWECDVEDRMPTLEDVFNNTPKHLGFNIEIKMATSPALAVTPQEELDRMINAILPVVERCQDGRQIAFSSFDPDMIAQLSKRLAGVPGRHSFWFLTKGTGWHADPRRTSLAAAVQFARLHALDGVVFESSALRKEPEAVQLATSYGLGVMTYGVENGDNEWVLQQRALGVQGVIVDDVARAVAVATVDKENMVMCYA